MPIVEWLEIYGTPGANEAPITYNLLFERVRLASAKGMLWSDYEALSKIDRIVINAEQVSLGQISSAQQRWRELHPSRSSKK